jgi:hypothetical protein
MDATTIFPFSQHRRESAISALKAAIKNDISRPEIQLEMNNRVMARQERIPLGESQEKSFVSCC